MVWDFFAKLGRQRMNAVQAGVKGKVVGAKAKAAAKASKKFNDGVDGVGKKAKGAATGGKKKKKGGGQEKAGKKDDKGMGLFSRKKGGGKAPPPEEAEPEAEASFGDKTQFIQVVTDERPKECVGWMVALNGAQKGQDFRLTPGKNMVGTAADCDVVLTDQYMSSRHAVIRYEEGVFMLVDLDSTNGSYVNDERCSKEELIDNDHLRFGRTNLKFKSLY